MESIKIEGTNTTRDIRFAYHYKGEETVRNIRRNSLTTEEALIVREEVADKLGLDLRKISNEIKTRRQEFVNARFCLFYYFNIVVGMGVQSIADMFNGMNHSSVINGRAAVKTALDKPETDPKLFELYNRLFG